MVEPELNALSWVEDSKLFSVVDIPPASSQHRYVMRVLLAT